MSNSFVNIALGIKESSRMRTKVKESLKIENGTQCTNYQMNNSIKNQIYPNTSHNTSLWTDGTIWFTESHTFQHLCSITNGYLCKMFVNFLGLLFLKCSENVVFLFKNTFNKEKGPFLFEIYFFCYFGGCHYSLNKALDKVNSKQLRNYNPANRKNWPILTKEPWNNICYLPIQCKVVFVLKY